ncbi:MAG: tRNA (N(6)-L-threonylcarbamoyladenosine(37)-C(2))-methylthiotransferase MtaB [Deltaproteobacteria bacterium]|nr:tRNA (N(6)-L-threonylcarbamoyladenosine(37)-C(2))-methylthiotransferase MtaB [Deltaproteobacteria bacterium]MBW1983856.1 tRNA (N(6)-L-threonylcarbamoyladenosine(37)-C(2))-methylthiotransferase MtaB [Deltaproteobacteria bacterium]MBW2365272.1 tRNA (N(6)-L-threonylcarbamoyladenosine(37)-C(2))-methylthiotransferase MtaB [Deltaproteobacteria bacterium]
MRKYVIKTLGCKVNQYESEAVSQSLIDAGFEASQEDEADICIINTCTVTGKASMQSRQAIRQAIRKNPNARIVVTGCYAQIEPEKLLQITGVHDIVVNCEKYKIPELVSHSGLNHRNSENLYNFDARRQQDFFQTKSTVFGHRTRPFLKIQDGCDAFCSYCIVPYARGPSRSMPFEMVLENIKKLKDSASHEVVLTGIHLGAYGLDLKPIKSLFELLYILNESKIIKRLRLSSIEPHELSNEIIQLVKLSDMICNHFHIPLQSGNDDILNKMNRPYSRSFFKDLIQNIHESVSEVSIGVDVIIGFPGETDKAFEDTYSLINELPVSYLHVFPFSPRQNTPAFKLPDKIPASVIKSRCKQMRELGNSKKALFYQKFIGKSVAVLVESTREKKTGQLKGFTSNYMPVLMDGPDKLKNTMVHARIEELNKNMTVKGIMTSNE